MKNVLNKILGVFLIVFLFGFLSKLLQWNVWPQLATYSGLGLALVLLLKSAIPLKQKNNVRFSNLALGLSFLFSSLSAFFPWETTLFMSLAGFFFLAFFVVKFITFIRYKREKKPKKNILILLAFAFLILTINLRHFHLQFADVTLILAFMMASIWIVREFIFSKSS